MVIAQRHLIALMGFVTVAGGVLLGLGSASAVASAKPAMPITPRPIASCQAAELNLSIGPSEGTAGTTYTDAVFTNQGSRTCTLRGYPAVLLTDALDQPLGSAATHNPAFPAQTVSLAPGQSAHAAMGFPQPGNFEPGVCSAISTNLRATAPGTKNHLETPLARQYCPGFSVTVIQPGV